MRIDKFLWCTRYFKTRNLATTACKKGLIRVNEQVAKPSREVFPQDKIALRKDQVELSLTVLEIPQNRVSAKQTGLYRLDTTSAEAFRNREMQLLAREHYRKKGQGRPTKKDRRDIDDYLDDSESKPKEQE